MGSNSNLSGSSTYIVPRKKNILKQKRRDDLYATGIVARKTCARNAARAAKFNASFRRTLANTVINKYASRRTSLFKSSRPMKAPKRRATIRTHEQFYDEEGRLFHVGDIVSLVDEEDGAPYFAQIRGLITDMFGDKKAALNWLIPLKTASDEHFFNAEEFVHGISDPEMYSIEFCSFISHAPDLPAYRKLWSPRDCMEQQLKFEMEERLRDLQAVASANLRFLDGPLVGTKET